MAERPLLSLLIFAIVLLLVQASAKNWNSRRAKCSRTPACRGLRQLDLTESCIDECMSPACYSEVYGASPLEPGEIDNERKLAFIRCDHRTRHDV
ncbi:hypothetical protein FOZ61_002066 [Perkinsus olseni]|uniref:Uncharacterized protein n=1 Tax=Perkinsus olseni TaxID=32597 RepID=A0A7J6LDE3_PEROL|nr:hypothetical protein FOL46_007535 [Perkinsus olseni]KAF4662930.1 hypothetical protein FOZ61_002066 [Perkinsus olseni]